jgi:type IV secretory pathway VirB2 component (pilin)
MSLSTLAAKAQLALAPPDPGAADLPAKLNGAIDKIVGMMITVGGIVAVIALIAAFIMLMIGEDNRGGSGGTKIMKVLAGLGGVLGAGSIVGFIWSAAG